jgi:hypothetical protein
MTETNIASRIDGKSFAKNIAFVSSLLLLGFVVDAETLASMLTLPTPWVRQQLVDKSVRQFVLELRRRHEEAQSDV